MKIWIAMNSKSRIMCYTFIKTVQMKYARGANGSIKGGGGKERKETKKERKQKQ